jgi:hypothetical protein
MALLREVILPSSEYIVIQYCDNDFTGNWQSIIRAALPEISRAEFEEAVNQHVQVTRYYPFKHIRYLIPSAWKMFSRQIRNALVSSAHSAQWTSRFVQGPGFEAMTFLSILDSNRELLRGRHLIVFEINGNNQNNTGFAAAVRRAAVRTPLLKELASMHVIDMSEVLNADDYFLLDDHINAGGHEKVARALAGILHGDNRWRVKSATDEPSISVSGTSGGRLDAVERKGSQAVITGWAPRNRNGEPPETLVLLRNGKPIAETEPVFRSDEPDIDPSEPATRRTGFAFAVRADLVTPDQPMAVVSKWKDGEARLIPGEIH